MSPLRSSICVETDPSLDMTAAGAGGKKATDPKFSGRLKNTSAFWPTFSTRANIDHRVHDGSYHRRTSLYREWSKGSLTSLSLPSVVHIRLVCPRGVKFSSQPTSKVSSTTTGKQTWLSGLKYAREIFRSQDSRRFVLGFTLSGSIMRLWEFDRLGATSSEPFDIHERGLTFVKVLLNFL